MSAPNSKLKIGVISVLCAGGALLLGNFGAMAAMFAGDRSPGYFAMQCFMVWGVLGGVSLGLISGLALGWLLGMRRLGPWLAVAACTGLSAVIVSVLAEGHVLPNDVNVLGPLHAGAVVAAAAASGLAFAATRSRRSKLQGEESREGTKH